MKMNNYDLIAIQLELVKANLIGDDDDVLLEKFDELIKYLEENDA